MYLCNEYTFWTPCSCINFYVGNCVDVILSRTTQKGYPKQESWKEKPVCVCVATSDVKLYGWIDGPVVLLKVIIHVS
jgi:hypothetical protein